MRIKLTPNEVEHIVDYFRARNPLFKSGKTRQRYAVQCKGALINALYNKTTIETLANALDLDRTSVYYHVRTHESNSIYRDYRDIYEEALYCVTRLISADFLGADDAEFNDIQELRAEVQSLRSKLEKMKSLAESQLNVLLG